MNLLFSYTLFIYWTKMSFRSFESWPRPFHRFQVRHCLKKILPPTHYLPSPNSVNHGYLRLWNQPAWTALQFGIDVFFFCRRQLTTLPPVIPLKFPWCFNLSVHHSYACTCLYSLWQETKRETKLNNAYVDCLQQKQFAVTPSSRDDSTARSQKTFDSSPRFHIAHVTYRNSLFDIDEEVEKKHTEEY